MKQVRRVLSYLLTVMVIVTAITSTGVVAHASMLPLEEVKAYLVLNGKTDEELSSMKLDDVLDMLVDSEGNKIEVSNNATTVWKYIKSNDDGLEEYKQYNIGKNETIDLSIDVDIKAYTVELIIGSSNQLDNNNIRYIIKVFITDTVRDEIGYDLYLQEASGNRYLVTPERKNSGVNTQIPKFPFDVNEYVVPEPENGNQYYLGISSIADEHPNIKTEVYDFWAYISSGGNTENIDSITDDILNPKMDESNPGLAINYGETNWFAIVYLDNNNNVIGQSFITFAAVSDTTYVDVSLYAKNGNEFTDAVLLNVDHIGFEDVDSSFAGKGIHEHCLMLKDAYSVDSELYCVLNAHGVTYGDQANSYVKKAVVGCYDSLEEAANCEDIKDQLIPVDQTSSSRGYKANYNYENGGVQFTIFFEDGNVWRLAVLAMEYTPKYDENYFKPYTDKPIIGQKDPWFNVTGAIDGNGKEYSVDKGNAYVVENGKNINMDTYYGYGYQTVFIRDEENDVDLSSLEPNFKFKDENRLYAVSKDTGNKVEEGHTRNFEEVNQQYTLVFDNNTDNERNYWITFKKLNNDGPELYVYGPREREVILDDYFEYKHDILIANIGNEPLEDISVELVDAENVKLDSYWTVGGDGNDTLASFTTTSTDKEYGELPNMAKIRLLPDGDGEVKGTLIIRAKDQDPVMITLNGTAQTPEIVTESLSEAVKYVPYQYIIATNNIHDWIKTEFNVVDGELPEGITLNKDTGELYGVPTVPDGDNEVIYKFTIEAKYSVEGEVGYFDSAYKEFKLKVKPNTNDNVYNASDEGYTIKKHIGAETENSHEFVLENIEEDQLFVSNGNYGEFVYLWLNGEKLYYDENDLDNSDYTKKEGSTIITIKSETFENKASKDKPNTIAMEFRNDDNEVNRTAQNFNIKNTPSFDASVENVISLINAIPSNVTLSDRGKVQTARNAYNSLSSTQKNSVTNYSKLTDAESVISKLETDEANKEATNKVVALINSLPNAISISDKTSVESARSAYDALTPAQKNYVSNYNKLLAAEDAINTLEKNSAAAKPVISLIDDIPTSITLDCKDEITVARNAYNKLTSEQKEYVTNYKKLQAAETAIETLETEEQERAKDRATAQPVIDLINAIPSTVTLESEDAITSARNAYNLLLSNQKGYVTNYSKLTNAEDKLAELKKDTDEKTVNMVCSIIDKDGKALVDYIAEIHSNVLQSRTDENGFARFSNVLIDEHTLIIKDSNGTKCAEKTFKIVEGDSLSISGNEITAKAGSTFTLSVSVNDGNISFLKVESGDKAPKLENEDDKTHSIDISDSAKDEANIDDKTIDITNNSATPLQTGDNRKMYAWYLLLIASWSTLVLIFISCRKKKSR